MFDDNRDHYDDATLIAAGGTPLHIRGVIPPTEYYSHVDDSVYTNAVAMASLQYASSVASALGLPPFVSLPWRVALSRLHFPEPARTQHYLYASPPWRQLRSAYNLVRNGL